MLKTNWLRYFWLGLGVVSLVVGTIGIVLPLLPTVPFYLLTVFCFSKGSPRLHRWFLSTNLYKKHLANFAKGKGMTLKSKLGVIIPVTILMGIAFYFANFHLARFMIGVVWIAHIYVFVFRIKTIS